MMMLPGLNIGISVFTVRGGHILNNGVNQNLAFLAMLLRAHPGVGQVYLLDGGDAGVLPDGMAEAIPGIPLVKPQDVTHDLDVVIEMGAQLPVEWMRRVRARGAKLVMFLAGHTFAGLAENPMFDRSGGLFINGTPWHEVWILPHHEYSCAPLLRTLMRVPVHVVPHIWSPVYLESQIAQVRAEGASFGFRPPGDAGDNSRSGWRIGIFEPNVSVVKNATIPMLACDKAFRDNPRAVDLMMVMNSFHMKEHRTFNSFATQLDLTRQGKATYEPRLPFVACMANHRLDAVVAHQWECGLNYAYYDALYGGYPLVHNSEFLRDARVGMFYPGFAASVGAAQILSAWQRCEPGFWADYSRCASAFLRGLAPDHLDNMSAFWRRLQAANKETP